MPILLLSLLLCSHALTIQGFVCRTNMEDRLKFNSRDEMTNIKEGGNPVLPYMFTKDTVSEDEKKLFKKIVKFYEEKTCIRLPHVENNFSQYHLKVHARAGCATGWHNGYTEIGMKGCGSVGVAHEIGHAYGWGHEQNRIDSSDHIYFVNGINGRQKGGFKDVEGIPYDYFSVMHYPSPSAVFTSAWLPRERKITFKIGHMGMNQPVQGDGFMTFNDIKRANFQFRCNRTCANFQTTWCENFGYLGPPKIPGAMCKCVCPYGTSGDRCEEGKAKFYSDFCGGTFDEDTIIKTPGYDQGKRTGDSRCTYIIKGKPGKQIKLTWLDFDIGYLNVGCHNGFVEVRTINYWFGSFYCKGLLPLNSTHITSIGMDLAIMIEPKYNLDGRGFKGKVEYIDSEKPIECDESQEIEIFENSEPKKIFFSTANHARKCTWRFKTRWPEGSIQIKFKSMLLAKAKTSKNVIDVITNPKESQPNIYRSFNDEMRNVSSMGSNMVLKVSLLKDSYFEADVIVLRPLSLLFPKDVKHCNSSVTMIGAKNKGSFVSPNYYGLLFKSSETQYPPNVYCKWTFKSQDPESNYINVDFEQMKTRIQVKFNTFEIDASDELILKSDTGDTQRVTKKKQYKLRGKTLSVIFKSDESIQKIGFFGNVWPSSK